MDKARRDYHVSIAEVADHDLWNVATIGVSCVSNDSTHAESVLRKVLESFDQSPEVSVESCRKETIRL